MLKEGVNTPAAAAWRRRAFGLLRGSQAVLAGPQQIEGFINDAGQFQPNQDSF